MLLVTATVGTTYIANHNVGRVQEFEKAGDFRDKEVELKAKIDAIIADKAAEDKAESETTSGSGPVVEEKDIANIVAQWTGIPVEKVRRCVVGAAVAFVSPRSIFSPGGHIARAIARRTNLRGYAPNRRASVVSAELDMSVLLPLCLRSALTCNTFCAQVSSDETERLVNMESVLHNRVIGQEEAVVAISRAIRRARVGLKNPNRPIASFIFSGPTGVGKSELAKTLATYYFGSEEAMVRLDMSEYMERHTVSKLIGSPPGYVGYSEGAPRPSLAITSSTVYVGKQARADMRSG